ncbi:MAG: YesL family protein [Eubacteriales bacterium]|nr:YesL family protein [Eubacteriales bacterium]
MGGIFRQDSKFTIVLNRIVDVVVLNMVFLLTCIPVITIGASLTSMYGVTLKWVNHEEPYVVRTYFKIWKESFVQSTICWMLEALVFMVIVMDVRVSAFVTGGFQLLLFVVTGLLGIIWLMSVMFVFPVIAKFQLPVKNILINSVCMPLSNLMSAITVIGISILPVIIAVSSSRIFYLWVYLIIMGWFAAIAYGASFFINRIFKMFIDSEEIEKKENISNENWID